MKMSLLNMLVQVSVVAMLCGCQSERPAPGMPMTSVSLVQLIASPARYSGRLVSVCGYYHREFEASAVYLTDRDAKYRIYRNGIWVGGSSPQANGDRIQRIDDGFVRIEGRFIYDPKGGGHLRLWSGEIGDLTLFQPLDAQ